MKLERKFVLHLEERDVEDILNMLDSIEQLSIDLRDPPEMRDEARVFVHIDDVRLSAKQLKKVFLGIDRGELQSTPD